jgi:predicted NUDIX family phosphoesterase
MKTLFKMLMKRKCHLSRNVITKIGQLRNGKRGMTYQDYTNHYITYALVLEEHYVFIGGGKGVSGYIIESLTVCHMCGKCHDSCT